MKKILWIALVSFSIMSCNSSPEKTDGDATVTLHEEEHHHDDSVEAIELNDGQKWQVNEEMKPFVEAGESSLTTFLNTSSTDFTALAKQLKEQDDALIKSCTMTGKSHDELHKWLHPHLELVEALSKATNEQQASELTAQLKKSFDTYHQYFQ